MDGIGGSILYPFFFKFVEFVLKSFKCCEEVNTPWLELVDLEIVIATGCGWGFTKC
jgi:hypothetical protein